MYTRSAVLAPPTYVGLGRFQHGPSVISVHVTGIVNRAGVGHILCQKEKGHVGI
jgi:hypothetical protein